MSKRSAKYFLVISIILLVFPLTLMSQEQRYRIQIVSSGAMQSIENIEGAAKLTGKPVFEHENAFLYCDSAILYEATNSIDCFGNVRIKSGDTLNVYGQSLQYSGNTKIANINKDVIVDDTHSSLFSDAMIFDRNKSEISYTTGGKIVNGDNTLESKKAYYYTNTKMAFFKENVVLKNPDNIINCDTLRYDTETQISYFIGPTTMKGKEANIYCEDGEYDRKNYKSRFSKNAKLIDKTRVLTGDSLFYDEGNDYGKAIGNITLIDTTESVSVKGNFAEYFNSKNYSYITQRAIANFWEDTDTLFLHADTLRVIFDSATNDTKDVFAYYKCKFYRNDIQGACDSLSYSIADSVITMNKKPVLWTDKNQITADTIIILMKNQEINQIQMLSNAFLVSSDSLQAYNQIKGKKMIANFVNKELDHLLINGNAESLYYVREEDKSLVGINIMKSSNMKVLVIDDEISSIYNYQKPEGVLYPDKDLEKDKRFLRDFKWRKEERPEKKEDIFK